MVDESPDPITGPHAGVSRSSALAGHGAGPAEKDPQRAPGTESPGASGIVLAPGQPVVGLDFDGVLNIVTGYDIPPGFEAHTVELDRAAWPTHPYIRPLPPGDFPVAIRVVTSRRHGDMVRAWQAAGAVVCWATTWERAVLRNAHLSNLPDLPVLEISKVIMDHRPHRTADWKVNGLQTAFAGHPIVWVDDFGIEVAAESVYGDPPQPMLVVAPDERVGLTEEQSQRIVEFIERTGRRP